jgi:hypothetical protein
VDVTVLTVEVGEEAESISKLFSATLNPKKFPLYKTYGRRSKYSGFNIFYQRH